MLAFLRLVENALTLPLGGVKLFDMLLLALNVGLFFDVLALSLDVGLFLGGGGEILDAAMRVVACLMRLLECESGDCLTVPVPLSAGLGNFLLEACTELGMYTCVPASSSASVCEDIRVGAVLGVTAVAIRPVPVRDTW